jgi:hypothetical protein
MPEQMVRQGSTLMGQVQSIRPHCTKVGWAEKPSTFIIIDSPAGLFSPAYARWGCEFRGNTVRITSNAFIYTKATFATNHAPATTPALANGENQATKSQVLISGFYNHNEIACRQAAPHPAFGHLLPACGEKEKSRLASPCGYRQVHGFRLCSR